MDLLQYLIAPHEHNQQQSQPPSTHGTSTSTQYQPPHHLNTGPDNSAQHAMSATSSMSLQQRDARIRTSAGIPSQIVTQGFCESDAARNQSQQQMSIDRAQLIQALAAHPDFLAALLKNGGLSALVRDGGTVSAGQARDLVARSDPDHGRMSMPVARTADVEYARPGAVRSGREGYDRGSGWTSVQDRPAAMRHRHNLGYETIQHRSGNARQTAVPTSGPRALCWFWYHFGNCSNDPRSPNYNGNGRICPFMHHLGPGMEDVECQTMPQIKHKNIGDCGLTRCRHSSNYNPPRLRHQPAASQSHTPSGPSLQHYRMESARTKTMPPITPASTAPTSPPKRKSPKLNKKMQPTAPALATPPPSLKRKASGLDSTPTLRAPTAPRSKKQKESKNKKPAKATTPPRYLDTIVDNTPESGVERQAPKYKKATCFFWYHGKCAKLGRQCGKMHALTDPPSFVQPPPGYIHEKECFRAWCPGDFLWDHAAKDGEGKEKKGKVEEVEEVEKVEEVEGGVKLEDKDVDVVDDEWYVQGFSDL